MCRLLFRKGPPNKNFSSALALMKRGGPDDSNVLASKGLELGHNRLAILDLSNSAAQPMEIGGVTILFNGEIYNYRELKVKFGIPCVSSGDTELILRLYLLLGQEMFNIIDGEFAIVIQDGGRVIAVRDALGVKPLYWCNQGD